MTPPLPFSHTCTGWKHSLKMLPLPLNMRTRAQPPVSAAECERLQTGEVCQVATPSITIQIMDLWQTFSHVHNDSHVSWSGFMVIWWLQTPCRTPFLLVVSLTGRAGLKKRNIIFIFYVLCITGAIILGLCAYNDLRKAQKRLINSWWVDGNRLCTKSSLNPEVFVRLHSSAEQGRQWMGGLPPATGAVRRMLIGCGGIVINPSALPLPTSHFLSYCWRCKPGIFLSELLRMKMFHSLFILDLSLFLMSFPKMTGILFSRQMQMDWLRNLVG